MPPGLSLALNSHCSIGPYFNRENFTVPSLGEHAGAALEFRVLCRPTSFGALDVRIYEELAHARCGPAPRDVRQHLLMIRTERQTQMVEHASARQVWVFNSSIVRLDGSSLARPSGLQYQHQQPRACSVVKREIGSRCRRKVSR